MRACPPGIATQKTSLSHGLIETGSVEVLTGRAACTPLDEAYGYEPGRVRPIAEDRAEIVRLMAGEASQSGSAPPSPQAVG